MKVSQGFENAMNSESRVPKVCFHKFEFTTYEDTLFQCVAGKNVNVYNVTFKSKKTYWSNSPNVESSTYSRIILPDEFVIPFSRESEKFSLSFCRLLFQKKFDIVVLPLSSIVSMFYSVLAKLAGTVIVWYITVHTLPTTFVGRLRALVIRTSLIASSHVVTLTNMHKKGLITLGFPEEKIFVIPHAVDSQLFTIKEDGTQLRERLGLTDGKILLSLGRLTEEKGLIFLIEAMKIVVKEVHNVHLLIVGEGPLRESLQQCVHSLELDDYVKFIAPVPPSEVPCFFSICDIHVAPSIVTTDVVEALGMVYLEAMSSGKPSIAFNIPAPLRRIVVHGETGYLVPEKDVDALANGICVLLNDDEKRKTMGKRAKEKASREFDVNRVADKWVSAFRRIIQS